MDRKVKYVPRKDLMLDPLCERYFYRYIEAAPLLRDEPLFSGPSPEIPTAYEDKNSKLLMFTGFYHIVSCPFQTSENKQIEVLVCNKPSDIQKHIECYFIHLLNVNRSPSSSIVCLINIISFMNESDWGPLSIKSRTRRALAQLANISEGEARKALSNIRGE